MWTYRVCDVAEEGESPRFTKNCRDKYKVIVVTGMGEEIYSGSVDEARTMCAQKNRAQSRGVQLASLSAV